MTDLTNPWEQIARRVAGEAAAAAALSFAHGQRCLTVVHGDPESADDEAALHRLHDAMFNLAVRAGGTHQQLVRTHGTNDTTTWWWTSSEQLNADQIVQQATRGGPLVRPPVVAHQRQPDLAIQGELHEPPCHHR